MELAGSDDYAWMIQTADGVWRQRVSKADYEYRGGLQMALQDCAHAASAKAKDERDKPPAAPFVQKTDAWVNLVLKRIITMAVHGDYDKVA
ncbi:hypothetical protein RZS08_33160, partial [Arthrospira platensis SPKY1]|nr:hypothetical protein [Arthrospira platensis SPKY1]